MRNYYRILGLQNCSSLEEIKRAYRSLALKFHPDRGGNEEHMKVINEAYEYLVKNKEEYDQTLLFRKRELKNYGFTIVVGGFGWEQTGASWTFVTKS